MVAESLFAGVRFRPGVASVVLGLPLTELRDQRVALPDVWSREVRRPHRRSARGPALTVGGGRELERRVPAGAGPAPVPDPLVQAAITEIVGRPGPAVGHLPDQLGVTERTLRRRVSSAVGYGPKGPGRIVRFRRFLAAAHDQPGRGFAALAAGVGYADQAHLSRECRELAGVTPGELLRDPRCPIRSRRPRHGGAILRATRRSTPGGHPS